MIKIGLTGGIGCGKSAATAAFAALGVPIIDADVSAREVVAVGSPGLRAIKSRFGAQLLNDDGSLNRQQLKDQIFADHRARKELEQILHPLIRAHMWQQLDQLDSAYAILDIPLLFETKQDRQVDRVLVVDCPEQLQIQRICKRDNISEPKARAIIQAQISRDQRLLGAHDVINNQGSIDQLQEQVSELHSRYLKLAGSTQK